jgi:hypothetical protein
MNKARYAFAVLAGIASAALPVLLFAQSGPSAPTAAPYRPGLGDLMTMTVQPRHIKLGLAARENNWSYAAYELHELEEAFERVTRHSPQWRKKPIAEMMASVTKEPMAALEVAIKAGDATRFAAAYTQLTEACNTCHQSAEVGVIAIQAPEGNPFPDQDFRPGKR